MKNLYVGAALMVVLLSSCAATPLVVKFTVPTTDNQAACGAPPVSSPLTIPVDIVLKWAGPRVDSLRLSGLAPGTTMSKSIYADAPAGDYAFTAWVEKTVNGSVYQSCSASATITISTKPDALRFNP